MGCVNPTCINDANRLLVTNYRQYMALYGFWVFKECKGRINLIASLRPIGYVLEAIEGIWLYMVFRIREMC